MKFISDIRNNLPVVVWEGAGICRTAVELEQGITQINQWRNELQQLNSVKTIVNLSPTHNYQLNSPETESQLKLIAETLNLVDVGYLILKSALFRTESRGGHYRLDYPDSLENWQVHTLIQSENCWKKDVILI